MVILLKSSNHRIYQKKNRVPESHRNKAFVLEHVLQAFLYKLVRSTNQIKIVYVIKLHKQRTMYSFLSVQIIQEEFCSSWDEMITSEVTLDPNSQPAPRGLTAHVSISSGSLHMRSQNGPSWGISQFRSITLICKQNVAGQVSIFVKSVFFKG